MQPQDNDNTRRDMTIPPRQNGGLRSSNRDAAAQLMRQQIDSIYDEGQQETQTTKNPYQQTYSQSVENNTSQSKGADWNKYHSEWQSYYQQYYERYYVGKVHEVKKNLESDSGVRQSEPEAISTDEAMYDLRAKLRGQIEERAKKVRKSRHFVPVMAGVMVMLIFLFLQYHISLLLLLQSNRLKQFLDEYRYKKGYDRSAFRLLSPKYSQ